MTRINRFLWILTLSILAPALLIAQAQPPATGRRATRGKRVAPPKFDKSQVERTFYSNVFENLNGERRLGATPVTPLPGGDDTPGGDPPGGKVAAGKWASVISSTVLEDEVKSIKLVLDREITTPGDFRGRGYKLARRDVSTLAMMFGIIAQYDGEVRFKKSAPLARETFARTAANCKVGTVQVYKEVKERRTDLEDLLNGNQLAGNAQNPQMKWSEICDRSPLMQRLEIGFNERVRSYTSNEDVFKREKEKLRHEAEILAALAQILIQEDMEDAGSDDYDGFCKEMIKAGRDVVDACKLDNYDQARKALGRIDKACTTCHDFYKG